MHAISQVYLFNFKMQQLKATPVDRRRRGMRLPIWRSLLDLSGLQRCRISHSTEALTLPPPPPPLACPRHNHISWSGCGGGMWVHVRACGCGCGCVCVGGGGGRYTSSATLPACRWLGYHEQTGPLQTTTSDKCATLVNGRPHHYELQFTASKNSGRCCVPACRYVTA